MTNSLQSLKYVPRSEGGPKLSVLDQLLVPDKKVYVDVPDVEKAWSVIRTMQIRGAPLIAIVACLGLAVDLTSKEMKGDMVEFVQSKVDYLKTSRPTAVNLFNALRELMEVVGKVKSENQPEAVVDAVVTFAESMLARDVADNRAIGKHGADCLLLSGKKKKMRLVTICNTGSLATAGYGTALGVARALAERGALESIAALETRPYNQGSRLTAFEMVEEQMPGAVLICDSASAALMSSGRADACVVGADRCCANGDTANKIGTHTLACVAAAHKVPFYVASPFSTLDTSLQSGKEIEIEERPASELLSSSRAPSSVACWNPAFDVTPAKLITGIITEKGVITKEPGSDVFDVKEFVKKHSCL